MLIRFDLAVVDLVTAQVLGGFAAGTFHLPEPPRLIHEVCGHPLVKPTAYMLAGHPCAREGVAGFCEETLAGDWGKDRRGYNPHDLCLGFLRRCDACQFLIAALADRLGVGAYRKGLSHGGQWCSFWKFNVVCKLLICFILLRE